MSQPTKTEKPTPSPSPFVHPGKKVFVLLPSDERLARRTSEMLEEPFSHLEVLPLVVQALRVGLVNDQNVVVVAHPITRRGKRADGTYGPVESLSVSAPISCGEFARASLDDGMVSLDVGGLTDAVQRATGTPELVARLSADKDLTKRTLKLFTT